MPRILSSLSLRLILVILSTIPVLHAQQTDDRTIDGAGLTGDQQEAASSSTSPYQRRYLVEVIIFNNANPVSSDGELWHRTRPVSFTADAAVPGQRAENAEWEEIVEFTQLRALLPTLYKLYSSDRYEVLTNVAWTQPLYNKRDSFAVELTARPWMDSIKEIKGPATAVRGSVRVFENRLLFVELDIENTFTDGTTNPVETAVLPIDPATPAGSAAPISTVATLAAAPSTEPPPGTYTLRDKRRVKLNELHYFDHPFFGVLVRVSRWETE